MSPSQKSSNAPSGRLPPSGDRMFMKLSKSNSESGLSQAGRQNSIWVFKTPLGSFVQIIKKRKKKKKKKGLVVSASKLKLF
jgi:hypothetical protein